MSQVAVNKSTLPKRHRVSRFISIGIPVLLCTAVLCVYGAFSTYRSARSFSTGVYLRSIATGLEAYAKNYGGYPPVGTDWRSLLISSQVAPDVHFVSPRSKLNRTSWLYVPPSAKHGEIKDPWKVILIFEDPASTDEDPLYVALADTSVNVMTREELLKRIDGAKLADGSVFSALRDPR